MESIIYFNNGYLEDEFEAIKERTLQIIKLGFSKAAASIERPKEFPIPSNPKSIEQISKKFLTEFGKTNSVKAKEIRGKSISFLSKPDNVKKLSIGNLANIKMNSKKSVTDDAKRLGLLSNIKLNKTIGTLLVKNKTRLDKDFYYDLLKGIGLRPNKAIGSSGQSTSGKNELRFNILKLKCLDPVDFEITDWAEDRINMGGMGADSLNQKIKVNEFFVNNFKNKELFKYNPKKRFLGFDLNTRGDWPRAYNVTVAIAEKDASGGFLVFLNELWDNIDEIVVQLVTAAAISVAGTIIGTAINPGVGTVIGAIVGLVIGAIAEWIFESLKDDIFDPVTQSIALPSNTALFPNNSTVSEIYNTEFTSSNARYLMWYQWELV